MRFLDASLEVKFEPRDLWVGVCWDWQTYPRGATAALDIFICLVPLLPLHVELVLR